MDAWLRGPIDGVPPLLMPAAHALVQTVADAEPAVAGLTAEQVWARPGGAASIGFHLRHIAGVVDRLLTYARGEMLSTEQLATLKAEPDPGEAPPTADVLLPRLQEAVQRALAQLRETSTDELLAVREVGRARVPSNVIGLIFHAAEHAQRHTGQIIATSKILRG